MSHIAMKVAAVTAEVVVDTLLLAASVAGLLYGLIALVYGG